MYELSYDYVKPKYGEKDKLHCIDKDSFTFYISAIDTISDIAQYVQNKFDTLNYELDRPFPKGKYKKVIVLMKNELDGKIMKELPALRAEKYCYLTDNNDEDKKIQKQKKVYRKKKT